jgi:hypothetical protein
MTTIRAIAVASIALAACGVQAQTMYRCGKTFQDRPCDANVTEQRIVPGGGRAGAPNGPSAAVAASPFAAECMRRGEHAQRITWQREGGATMERQINDARGNRELIDTIQSVYSRRGTAPEIRSQIENECVAQKQRQSDAAAALATLQKQAGPQGAPAPADAAPIAQARPVVANTGPNPACEGLKRQKDDIEARARRGGSAHAMESLNRERRDVERQMSDAKC